MIFLVQFGISKRYFSIFKDYKLHSLKLKGWCNFVCLEKCAHLSQKIALILSTFLLDDLPSLNSCLNLLRAV